MQFDTSHMITHREMLPQQRRAIGSKLFFQRQKLLLRRQGRASRGGVLPLAGICTLAILGLTVGCTPAPSRMSYDSAGDIGDVISGDQMFDDVVRTLNTLDKSLVTELRPPVVIRDANTSRNRKPMLAILTQHPDPSQRTGVCNTLIVRTRNAQFHREGRGEDGIKAVQPGDRVRYFAKVSDAAQFGGAFKYNAIEMEVIAVPEDSEDVLIVSPGTEQPILAPQPVEVWRDSDHRINEIGSRSARYVKTGKGENGWRLPRHEAPQRHQAEIGWEPTPDETALAQIVDRLNQWVNSRQLLQEWRADPLIGTLPERLQILAQPGDLDRNTFLRVDSRYLQECLWQRDIARWVAAQTRDPVAVARKLFDWTVRNLQLETRETMQGQYYSPWYALLFGQGTAEDRARIFALLARQQNLDVVVLSLPAENGQANFWLPALLHEGELYLFDVTLGIPIPGSQPESVATLAEVIENDALLRQLDLPDAPYPVESQDLSNVTAGVVASPWSLAKRFEPAEARMAGNAGMTLSVDPTALAERLEKIPQVGATRLWAYPFEVLDKQLSVDEQHRRLLAMDIIAMNLVPRLWKGRVLHLQGKFDYASTERLYGEEVARGYDRTFAKQYYGASRRSDADIEKMDVFNRQIYAATKLHASYWMGCLAFDDGDYEVAIDFCRDRVGKAAPESRWVRGARYNLARALEASGQFEEAVRYYATDTSPQRHGNALRGRWLAAKLQSGLEKEQIDSHTPAAPVPAGGAAPTEEASPKSESGDRSPNIPPGTPPEPPVTEASRGT